MSANLGPHSGPADSRSDSCILIKDAPPLSSTVYASVTANLNLLQQPSSAAAEAAIVNFLRSHGCAEGVTVKSVPSPSADAASHALITALASSSGYLGGAPDPGCEFTASTSPKNTGERSKIILYNEYGESEWSSVMTNHNSSQSNKNTIFPYSFSFHLVSGPTKHLLNITFFASFLFRIRPFCEKWIILIYHSSCGKFLEAVNSQNPLCWIRCTSQVAFMRPQYSPYRLTYITRFFPVFK